MHRLDIDTVLEWRGNTVRDAEGEKIGTFGDVFLDAETDAPAWGGVRTGLFGRSESYVPLAAVEERDGDLFIPYSQAQVKDAPQIDPDVSLTPEEEQVLYDHYGQEYRASAADGPSLPEGEMIRSEEEVHVHEGPLRPTERVRLKKVPETEPPPENAVDDGQDAGEAPR